jgi:AraC-like DNA-binding protein
MFTLAWDGTATDRIHVTSFGSHRVYAFAEHGHRGFCELICVRHGVLDHRINGVLHRQGPGGLALVRPRDRHGLAGERMAYVNISFDEAFLRALRTFPHLRDDCLAAADGEPAPIGVLPAVQRAPFLAACDRLAAARGGGDEGARFFELLMQALRACHRPPAQEASSAVTAAGPTWLSRLEPLLGGDDDPGTLATLIRRAGVSHAHLARTLRKRFDLTPSGFLNRCRAQRAARLLAATDLPITTIALDLGYSDPGYFARIFTRHFGIGPRAWRRQEQRFIH